MTPAGFLRLAWQSVVAPRDVARLLLALHLGREALLTAFALVVVINGMVFALSGIALPQPNAGFGPLLRSPALFVALLAVTLTVVALSLTWTGRALGGTARIEAIGVLLIWLQALRVLVQLGAMVLAALNPLLAAVGVMGASALGVWILVNFLAVAHEFESLLKAFLTLLLGVTGIVLGLSFALSLFGVTTTGLTNV